MKGVIVRGKKKIKRQQINKNNIAARKHVELANSTFAG